MACGSRQRHLADGRAVAAVDQNQPRRIADGHRHRVRRRIGHQPLARRPDRDQRVGRGRAGLGRLGKLCGDTARDRCGPAATGEQRAGQHREHGPGAAGPTAPAAARPARSTAPTRLAAAPRWAMSTTKGSLRLPSDARIRSRRRVPNTLDCRAGCAQPPGVGDSVPAGPGRRAHAPLRDRDVTVSSSVRPVRQRRSAS